MEGLDLEKWQIRVNKRVLKDLDRVEKNYFLKIKNTVNNLVQDLFPENVNKLKGKDDLTLRLRIGVYRIIYLVEKKKRSITILGISNRKSSYRNWKY